MHQNTGNYKTVKYCESLTEGRAKEKLRNAELLHIKTRKRKQESFSASRRQCLPASDRLFLGGEKTRFVFRLQTERHTVYAFGHFRG